MGTELFLGIMLMVIITESTTTPTPVWSFPTPELPLGWRGSQTTPPSSPRTGSRWLHWGTNQRTARLQEVQEVLEVKYQQPTILASSHDLDFFHIRITNYHSGGRGEIQSPNYPSVYPHNLEEVNKASEHINIAKTKCYLTLSDLEPGGHFRPEDHAHLREFRFRVPFLLCIWLCKNLFRFCWREILWLQQTKSHHQLRKHHDGRLPQWLLCKPQWIQGNLGSRGNIR